MTPSLDTHALQTLVAPLKIMVRRFTWASHVSTSVCSNSCSRCHSAWVEAHAKGRDLEWILTLRTLGQQTGQFVGLLKTWAEVERAKNGRRARGRSQ